MKGGPVFRPRNGPRLSDSECRINYNRNEPVYAGSYYIFSVCIFFMKGSHGSRTGPTRIVGGLNRVFVANIFAPYVDIFGLTTDDRVGYYVR